MSTAAPVSPVSCSVSPAFQREFLPLAKLSPWEKNPRGGELREIEAFAAQLRVEGIREDLHAFALNGVLTLMQGHRRQAAGVLAGIENAWVRVWDFTTEEEAFKHLLTLQNGADPFDSRELALAAQTGLKMGLTKVELVGAMHRSPETVQLYLDLGSMPGRIQDAVFQGKMTLSTASQLRKLPTDKERLEAAGKILQGNMLDEPMSEAQAKNWLHQHYFLPRQWETEWLALRAKLMQPKKFPVVDGYRYVEFADRADFALGDSGMPQGGYIHADAWIDESDNLNPREPKTWLSLARDLDAPVYVVAAPIHKDGYTLLVDLKMVWEADALRHESLRVLKERGRGKKAKPAPVVVMMEGEDEDRSQDGGEGLQTGPQTAEYPREEADLPDEDENWSGACEWSEEDLENARQIMHRAMARLATLPEVAMRDKCFRPLVATMFGLLDERIPQELMQDLQNAFRDDRAKRCGLRWVLSLLLLANIAESEDDEVMREVLFCMGVTE